MYTDLNQTPHNNQHTHTMRNILVPMLVVVVLIIVGLFLSGKVSFNSESQGAAVGSAVQTKLPPSNPSQPARVTYFLARVVGNPCVEITFDDETGDPISMTIGTTGSDYSCNEFVVNNNITSPTKTYRIFGPRVTSNHYKLLQVYLSQNNYLPANYKTGKLDSKTKTAIGSFQQTNGISVTNTLNTPTKIKLNQMISASLKPGTRVDNSQNTDQENINNPASSTGGVCDQALSWCITGCHKSGNIPHDPNRGGGASMIVTVLGVPVGLV